MSIESLIIDTHGRDIKVTQTNNSNNFCTAYELLLANRLGFCPFCGHRLTHCQCRNQIQKKHGWCDFCQSMGTVSDWKGCSHTFLNICESCNIKKETIPVKRKLRLEIAEFNRIYEKGVKV